VLIVVFKTWSIIVLLKALRWHKVNVVGDESSPPWAPKDFKEHLLAEQVIHDFGCTGPKLIVILFLVSEDEVRELKREGGMACVGRVSIAKLAHTLGARFLH
jgi:hypothetical protein